MILKLGIDLLTQENQTIHALFCEQTLNSSYELNVALGSTQL
jgi:hypothetical protein